MDTSNRAHTLSKIAEERRITVRELVVSTVEQAGSIPIAATQLGVTAGALRYHLRKRRLRASKRVIIEPVMELA